MSSLGTLSWSDVLFAWQALSFVLPKAARFDAVKVLSILEANESELLRGLPPSACGTVRFQAGLHFYVSRAWC